MKSLKALSALQVIVLILGMVSLGFVLGESFGEVEARGAHEAEHRRQAAEAEARENGGTVFPITMASTPTAWKIGDKLNLGGLWGGGNAATTTATTTASTTTTTAPAAPAKTGLAKFFATPVGQVLVNAGYAYLIYQAVKFVGPLLGLDGAQTDAAAKAAGVGYFAGWGAGKIGLSKAIAGEVFGVQISAGVVSFGIGLAVAAVVFLLTYKKTDEKKVSFSCYAWEPPIGGDYCDECNHQGLIPCTEYQCKSLGQACEFVDQGDESLCLWKDRHDARPPFIVPWDAALTSEEFSYVPVTNPAPDDKGAFIKYNYDANTNPEGCIPPWTPFDFGITITGGGPDNEPEPAICKVDWERKQGFDEMMDFFGKDPSRKFNHTQSFSLPSREEIEAGNLVVENGGNYDLFVKCQDINGNHNEKNFVFKFCLDQRPDITLPRILYTSIANGAFIGFDETEVPITIGVNKPADCRWSHDRDMIFIDMPNNMTCPTNVFEHDSQLVYPCHTTLDGLGNEGASEFYFRCRDSLGNEMVVGERFVLQGSRPLVIEAVGPTGVITDRTTNVQVNLQAVTSGGAEQGKAFCGYSQSCYVEGGSKEYFTPFQYVPNERTHSHSYDIRAPAGTYECVLECRDAASNVDQREFMYTIESDTTSPEVVRVYSDGPEGDRFLKIITNEDAECVWNSQPEFACSYEFVDGIPMSSFDGTDHFTEWDPDKTYYIKCKDAAGNYPLSNACTITARPFANIVLE